MRRRGFSLASLLLLTAVVAVFLAAICTLWLHDDAEASQPPGHAGPDPYEALAVLCAMGGMLVGLFVGLVIGAGQLRPLWGICLGVFVGMITGTASGVLLAAPGKMLPILVGSLLIVLFGAVVRRYSARPPK